MADYAARALKDRQKIETCKRNAVRQEALLSELCGGCKVTGIRKGRLTMPDVEAENYRFSVDRTGPACYFDIRETLIKCICGACRLNRRGGTAMEELLERLLEECRPAAGQGKVADYIPELSKGDPEALGIYVIGSEGKQSWAVDCRQVFTIQSVVKPILLLQALMDNGAEFVMSRVGVEATGKPFDAINFSDQSLDSGNINPMVNMGAIVMCSLIHGRSYDERFQRLLELTRRLAGGEIGVDQAVYRSEKSHGSKNRALAYLLKSNGLLDGDVEEVLDCYFRACSIQVDCRALAHIGAVLSNRGRLPVSNERIFPAAMSRYVNAILMTCGMYDGSGEFALRVGVPAKSGVGGGIMAVVPTRMGIGIFGPALDRKGNSVAGIRLLERLSAELHLSIF